MMYTAWSSVCTGVLGVFCVIKMSPTMQKAFIEQLVISMYLCDQNRGPEQRLRLLWHRLGSESCNMPNEMLSVALFGHGETSLIQSSAEAVAGMLSIPTGNLQDECFWPPRALVPRKPCLSFPARPSAQGSAPY
jgi:hypothetical protein